MQRSLHALRWRSSSVLTSRCPLRPLTSPSSPDCCCHQARGHQQSTAYSTATDTYRTLPNAAAGNTGKFKPMAHDHMYAVPCNPIHACHRTCTILHHPLHQLDACIQPCCDCSLTSYVAPTHDEQHSQLQLTCSGAFAMTSSQALGLQKALAGQSRRTHLPVHVGTLQHCTRHQCI